MPTRMSRGVRVLADNLHRAGRDVFFDRWEVVGGNRLSQRLQQGWNRRGSWCW